MRASTRLTRKTNHLRLETLEERTVPVAGALDATFSADGIERFDLPGFSTMRAARVFIQPDGKPVLVGTADSSLGYQAALFRLNKDGGLDTSFDGDGAATIAFTSPDNSWAHFNDGVLQPDGKIVATGTAYLGGNPQVLLARFNDDGSLDTSFGNSGFTLTDITNRDENGFEVALQSDGRIVVAGSILNDQDNGFLILRYTTDGILDTSFSGDGYQKFNPGGRGASARSLVIQPDGKIVAFGGGSPVGSPNMAMMIVRLNDDGSFDQSFDSDGIATAEFSESDTCEGYDLALLPDGRLLGVGGVVIGGYGQHAMVRFLSNGSLDPSFDVDGRVVFDFPVVVGGVIEGVALQPDGKIVGVGNGPVAGGGPSLIMRFNEDGSLDSTFGPPDTILTPGVVATTVQAGGNFQGVTIRPDGRMIAVGDAGGDAVAVQYIGESLIPMPDSYDAVEDVLLPIGAPGVLANDTILEGNPQAIVVRPPEHASLFDLQPDGSFTYTSELNFNGTDSFSYKLVAGTVSTSAVTVTLNVQPANDPPTTLDDAYDVPSHSPMSVSKANGVLKNDKDFDGDTLHATLIDPTSIGSVNLQDDGSFTFTFPLSFIGSTTFTYRVNDGTVDGTIGTVTLTRPTNQPPDVMNDVYDPPHRSPLVVSSAEGVLKNDADLNDDEMHVILVDLPSIGNVILADNGSFTYTYPASLASPVTFTYKVNDGTVDSAIATVTIHRPPNNLPQAFTDNYQVPVASPFTVLADAGVLKNDTDADGDQRTATLVSQPVVGTVTMQPTGSFSYAFPADFVGSVTFTYRVSDESDSGNTATVTLTREGLAQATGNVLTIVGGSTVDFVRLRAGTKGAFRVEMQSATGLVVQSIPLPAGIKKFATIEVYLGDGNDRLDAAGVKVPIRVVGGAGDDYLRTGVGADFVFGDATDGTGSGSDVIETGMGNDSVVAGNGRDAIDSGLGNDTVTAGTDGSFIDAGAGNDIVTAAGGVNYILGGAGKDVLVGGLGADILDGGSGNDLLVGGLGADLLDGGAGNDILFDGKVALVDSANDSLARILASYIPTKRTALAGITARLIVTFDTGATDTVTGGLGTDWFWSNDALDLLDRQANEPKNQVH